MQEMKRRTFLASLTAFFAAAATALFSLPVLRFFGDSAAEAGVSEFYPVADLSELSQEVTSVRYTRLIRDGWLKRTIQETVWLSRQPDGSYVAFEPHCTHLGCAYAWNEAAAQFVCPCHGGKFDRTGKTIAGPPPRGLDRYEIQIADGILRIGKIRSA